MNQPRVERLSRRDRLKGLPFNRMIPNILTLLALCAGMTAIRYGLQERWEHAGLALLVAAILDGLDGRIARVLKGASKFGAELDSLSDFICFGVAPALLLYMWTLSGAGRIGWVLALLFSVCCVLRLARFNTNMDETDRPAWTSNFFAGVPAPAGGGLVMLPMFLSFQFGDGLFKQPAMVAVFVVVVSALMISRIPTFAFKKFRVAPRWILPTMLLVGLFAASLVSAPWLTMAATLIVYMASIPFSLRSYRKLEQAQGDTPDATPLDAAGGAPPPNP
ncbi:MAG: CDP-diacylglycerol--serine O-phosphatidyltransferase [Rhodospirillales bacterium]|nr:CDP-diacylglycerol--serine O-phosphatidyltransferase [Rhodospirillales bacterium]MDP6882626.1 CDP-diacylglycerol--serine O-phosphatidyltransferase [Rhodospirillales bacterium]